MGTAERMDFGCFPDRFFYKGDSTQKKVVIDHQERTVTLSYAVNFPFKGHKNRRRYERERDLLFTLKHDNLVEMDDYDDDVNGLSCIWLKYISPLSLQIVIFYAEYSYTANTILHHWQQLLSVASYLAGKNYVHRDIKPENLMLDDSGNLKLIDFELAKLSTESPTNTYDSGSKAYVPPEAMPDRGTSSVFNEKGDVYSIGVTMWETIARKLIMGDAEPNMEDWKLIDVREEAFSKLFCDEAFTKIIEWCTARSIQQRCTASEAMGKVEEIIKSSLYASHDRIPIYNRARTNTQPEMPIGLNARWLPDVLLPPRGVSTNNYAETSTSVSQFATSAEAKDGDEGDKISTDLPFNGNTYVRPALRQSSSSSFNEGMPAGMSISSFQDASDSLLVFLGSLRSDEHCEALPDQVTSALSNPERRCLDLAGRSSRDQSISDRLPPSSQLEDEEFISDLLSVNLDLSSAMAASSPSKDGDNVNCGTGTSDIGNSIVPFHSTERIDVEVLRSGVGKKSADSESADLINEDSHINH